MSAPHTGRPLRVCPRPSPLPPTRLRTIARSCHDEPWDFYPLFEGTARNRLDAEVVVMASSRGRPTAMGDSPAMTPRRASLALVALAVAFCTSAATGGTPPPGATAQCKDGTYSYSLHRSGTCSRVRERHRPAASTSSPPVPAKRPQARASRASPLRAVRGSRARRAAAAHPVSRRTSSAWATTGSGERVRSCSLRLPHASASAVLTRTRVQFPLDSRSTEKRSVSVIEGYRREMHRWPCVSLERVK